MDVVFFLGVFTDCDMCNSKEHGRREISGALWQSFCISFKVSSVKDSSIPPDFVVLKGSTVLIKNPNIYFYRYMRRHIKTTKAAITVNNDLIDRLCIPK